MLHKAESIKEFSSQRQETSLDIWKRRQQQENFKLLPCVRLWLQCCMRETDGHSQILLNPELLERNINLRGNSYNIVSFLKRRPHSLTLLSTSKQEPVLFLYVSSYWHHTANRSPSTSPLPRKKSLCCSALLSLALPFSAKSQIGGWEVFCGPNKRAKVVRTPLYESVGLGWGVGGLGGGQWPKQLVFQAWAYTDQQAWAVAWQQ